MEAALSRWSILVQLGVVLVLTALFFAAWVGTRRRVLATWVWAWTFDVAALAAVLVIAWPDTALGEPAVFRIYVIYSSAKVLFVMLLALGLFQYRRVRASMAHGVTGWVASACVAWGVMITLTCRDLVQVQALSYGAVALILIAGGLPAVLPGNSSGARVAGLVFLFHGMLFSHHMVVLTPTFWGHPVPAYMSRISFLDAVSEFLVGLGCILAMGLRTVAEAEEVSTRLEASEKALRNLVDADPLTGLFNRRRLRTFVEGAHRSGIVLYLDVDKFKVINDSWGHAAGDGCLLRVAETLRQVFRATDGLFRLGGDEFLVVAPGLTVSEGQIRIRKLRESLGRSDRQGIVLSVSVGMAPFAENIPLDEAMAAADAAMYEDKAGKSL